MVSNMISRMAVLLRQVIAKSALVLAGVFVSLCLMQTSLQAAPLQGNASTLAADSAEIADLENISPAELEQKRAKRRQAQSQASRAADQENTGSVADQLNLEEIVEDNVLLGNEPDSTSVEP
jgi:hypothetical protein